MAWCRGGHDHFSHSGLGNSGGQREAVDQEVNGLARKLYALWKLSFPVLAVAGGTALIHRAVGHIDGRRPCFQAMAVSRGSCERAWAARNHALSFDQQSSMARERASAAASRCAGR